MRPFFSVCIPAYNRAQYLPALLDSIFRQDFTDYEIVICEDGSPERDKIVAIVAQYQAAGRTNLHVYQNAKNLGYDGNFRELLVRSRGTYCFFVGNDDLLYEGALKAAHAVLTQFDHIGVLLRSYYTFIGEVPTKPVQTYHYFDANRFFPAGTESIVTFFRRCVVISGLTIYRDKAVELATEEFDGTLLYQQHLVGNILKDMNGVYCHAPMAWYRLGGVPDFGNAEAERLRFVPKEQTSESSVAFMEGMLRIAKSVEAKTRLPVYDEIVKDIGNYSYPILSIQSKRPRLEFLRYYIKLCRIGLGHNNRLFHLSFLFLLLFGSRSGDFVIKIIKRWRGSTPVLGRIYQGEAS